MGQMSDAVSEDGSVHSSDAEFLNNSEGDSGGEGWEEDQDGVLTAHSDTFRGMAGSTIGLKRFAAMVASIERRAIVQDTKRKARVASRAAARPSPRPSPRPSAPPVAIQ